MNYANLTSSEIERRAFVTGDITTLEVVKVAAEAEEDMVEAEDRIDNLEKENQELSEEVEVLRAKAEALQGALTHLGQLLSTGPTPSSDQLIELNDAIKDFVVEWDEMAAFQNAVEDIIFRS